MFIEAYILEGGELVKFVPSDQSGA